MSTVLFRLGHVAARHPWRVISSWIVVAAAVALLNSNLGGEANDMFRLPGAESQRAAEMLEDEFPSQGQFTSQVVFDDDQALTDPASRLVIEDAVNELAGMPHVVSVTDPFAASEPTVSPDASVALSTVTFDTNDLGQIDAEAADHALAPARSAGLTAEYNGLLGAAGGETEAHSELIGMGIAVLVLVLAFGSLVAVSLPIGVALISLLVGTSTNGVLSGVVTIPTSATLVGSMLGLGVGIDYALFVLARHRDNLLGPGLNIHDSAGRANATAGLSVLFAGGTVILAIAGLQLAGVPMISAMGWSSALMVAVAVVAALTLLPAILLDVTLVRMVLVPAAMSLLGHRAWQLPWWLDRVLPDVDLDGHRAATSHPATMEPVPTYAGHSGASVGSRVSR